jgi:hypothetical protein
MNYIKALKKTKFAFLMAIASGSAFGLTPNQETGIGLAGAYGFLIAQNFGLDKIEKEFPELSRRVRLARLMFDASYGDATEKVEKRFVELFKDQNVNEVLDQLKGKVIEEYENEKLSREDAEKFIETVERRSKGDIESERAKRFIHGVIFEGSPEKEFASHEVQYDLSGHSKSKGLNIIVKMPYSWVSKESSFPNTLKTWSSVGGVGDGFLGLEIHKLDGANISKEDVQKSSKSGVVPGGIVGKNALKLKVAYTEISRLPALMVDSEEISERLGDKFFTVGKRLIAYNKDKVLILNCMTAGAQKDEEQIRKNFERIGPLCKVFYISLVVKNMYN